MRLTAILSVLAVLVTAGGCGGRNMTMPEERPGDFSVILTSETYPAPAPDLRVTLFADGTGSYLVVFKPPRPGQASGPFQATPDQMDELFRAVQEAEFFELDTEYIEDPPIPGRGVDTVVVSAGGSTHQVRSEYAMVEQLDIVRAAVMKIVPPQAYSGGSLTGTTPGYVVDRTTKLIYDADAPELEDIPEENRIEFQSLYEALDAGYHPSPGLRERSR
jgi:hypothetical protein